MHLVCGPHQRATWALLALTLFTVSVGGCGGFYPRRYPRSSAIHIMTPTEGFSVSYPALTKVRITGDLAIRNLLVTVDGIDVTNQMVKTTSSTSDLPREGDLPLSPGSHTLQVSGDNRYWHGTPPHHADTVTFTVDVLSMAVDMGNGTGAGQTGVVGAKLPVNPSVKVVGPTGQGVQGISVIFQVSSGGGSISDIDPLTNAQGIASVDSWTLGPVVGIASNGLRATSTGVTGSPVDFSATSVASANEAINVYFKYGTPPLTSCEKNGTIHIELTNGGASRDSSYAFGPSTADRYPCETVITFINLPPGAWKAVVDGSIQCPVKSVANQKFTDFTVLLDGIPPSTTPTCS
jgi:hypothetical protein